MKTLETLKPFQVSIVFLAYICVKISILLEKEQEILTKASELFLRIGIKSVSMDDISRELGISKKTLYQYVDNKSDLIQKVVLQHCATEEQAILAIHQMEVDSIEELLIIARHVSMILREINPSAVYDLKKYYSTSWRELEERRKGQIYQVIHENLIKGIQSGLYRQDIDPDIIARFYVGNSSIVVDEEVFPVREYNKEKVFLAYIKYHIQGIASKKGLEVLEKHLSEK